jgi:hypothetical protein
LLIVCGMEISNPNFALNQHNPQELQEKTCVDCVWDGNLKPYSHEEKVPHSSMS